MFSWSKSDTQFVWKRLNPRVLDGQAGTCSVGENAQIVGDIQEHCQLQGMSHSCLGNVPEGSVLRSVIEGPAVAIHVVLEFFEPVFGTSFTIERALDDEFVLLMTLKSKQRCNRESTARVLYIFLSKLLIWTYPFW